MRAIGLVLGMAALVAACSGADAPAAGGAEQVALTEEAAAAPAPSGRVIEVKMITDDAGNYFEPAVVEAAPGDVVRYTLVSGVHNVSFPAEQNAQGLTLPEPSEYLQLPGQTHDLVVNLPAGEYAFQCDPHAALGMVGKLVVR